MGSIRSPRSTSSLAGGQLEELEAFARFCENALTTEDGAPFVLEGFQLEILADYFAGRRELVVVMPKKQGKSTLLGALALWHLLAVPFAEAIVVAAARDQAGILLRQVTGFVRRSPQLRSRLKVVQREVRNDELDGRLRVLASDVDTVDGQLPTFVALDELHRHRRAELYAILRDGLGPRGGQMVAISTAGDDEESPLGRLRAAAYELPGLVRDGAHRRAVGGSFVFHEWALDSDDDVHDLTVVKEANPASWVTLDELRERHDSPSMTDWAWRRFTCGQWIQGEFGAFQALEWERCAMNGLTVPEGARVPYLGVDLGWKWDTTAIVPVWIVGGGWSEQRRQVRKPDPWGRGAAYVREWVRDETPETAIVGAPRVLVPPGDGSSLPVETVFEACAEMAGAHTAPTFVLDPLAGGEQLAQRLDAELDDARVVTHSQANTAMCRASQRLAEMVASGRIRHPDDPTLNAHVLACGVRQVGEGWRLAKQPGSRAPIDAAVALAMALSAGLDDGQEKPERPPGGRRFASFA